MLKLIIQVFSFQSYCSSAHKIFHNPGLFPPHMSTSCAQNFIKLAVRANEFMQDTTLTFDFGHSDFLTIVWNPCVKGAEVSIVVVCLYACFFHFFLIQG